MEIRGIAWSRGFSHHRILCFEAHAMRDAHYVIPGDDEKPDVGGEDQAGDPTLR